MAVRREKVVLDLESNLPEGMLRGAAATQVLRMELERLSGASVRSSRVTQSTSRDMDKMSASAAKADNSINQLTGRLRLFADAAAILGPALAPLGGVAVTGLAGLASQMGFAAVAGGVLIGSLQGVGDALSAMNAAQIKPSVENLQKAEDALKRLSPAARDFAEAAFDLKPALAAIRDMGAEGLIPGLTESLNSLEELGPRVGAIFETIATTSGEIASDSAASLASDRWADFFQFIEDEAPRALSEMSATVGDVVHGLAELWQAFTPLNNDFSGWLMDVAAGFDAWASGLSATDGFSEFIDYVRTTGPQVADTLGALANAVVQIVQATAPLGGPVLAAVEGFAKAVGAIADSDIGTPIFAGVAALALLNRTLKVTEALSKTTLSGGMFASLGTVAGGAQKGAGSVRTLTADLRSMSQEYGRVGKAQSVVLSGFSQTTGAAQRTSKALGGIAKGTAVMGGLALASTGAADGLGLTNTTSLALMGTLGGPPGAAIGAAAGALLDFKAAGEGSTAAIRGLDAAIRAGDIGALQEQIAAAKAELTDINNLDFGGDIFDRIGFQVADTFGGKSPDEAAAEIKRAEQAVKDLAAAEEARVGASRRAALTYASEVGLNAELSVWRRKSVEEIKAQADALQKVRDGARATADAFLGFGDSLNDSKVSLADFITDMQKSADALRNFNSNSLKAARKGLDEGLIESLRAAGTEGALRMKQLANATTTEIARANKAHRSQTAALEQTERVAERLAGLDPVVKVKAETSGAMRDIEGLEARLRAIKDEDVNIVVRQIGSTTLGPRNEAADGATVPKTGKPYADRHLYLLADGEEVISNRYGQADRYRSLLKKINANRRLAGGGTAGEDKKKPRKPQVGAAFYAEDNTAALQASIDYLAGVAEDQTKALERSTDATQFWAGKMSEVAKATVSGFNTGLFDKSSDPWAAGAGGGAIFNLSKDIAGLGERAGLQQQLAAMGLSGDALGALLSEGTNADISALIGSGQVSQYASLYAQRAALQGSVGSAAGQMAYGGEYAAAQAQQAASLAAVQATERTMNRVESRLAAAQAALERMEANAPERTGAEVGRVINNGAATGHRGKGR